MKFANFWEKCFGIGGKIPFYTLLYNSFMFFARNGGLRVVSSYITQPRDHISHFELYGLSFHTSGGQ